ncbi:DNA-binding PadR family transcriptional regulator [Spinactinospora alkalitolerans]|uniref:DNA-binding PadR family transcriptional regulator n=1 Tax=Spinactinospora alkalitolerans TaxID=687207 RepID=A0A852TUZ3_9ACTN|nr:PadR family transcriptional regulator [Spinactinospora alkalitolerans]NYE48276.1 DNA-binding PadR family transcriptional regulator [Spinactinospora alkalitolerans]
MALREQSYLMLLALTEGPRHGYAIITAVRDLSDGRVRIGAGTLYGALDRLSGEGLVSVSREEIVNGRNRRYYRLTEDGQRVLAEETERLARLAALARRLLAPRPQPGMGAL